MGCLKVPGSRLKGLYRAIRGAGRGMILFHDRVAEFYWLRYRVESCSGLAAGFPEAI
mgnify:CR=1 FL=1